MQYYAYGTGPLHRAPFPNGPVVELLGGRESAGDRTAAARVQIPPGGVMPEHDHGDSEALVMPIDGDIVLVGESDELKLELGVVVRIERGERVRVENRGSRPAAMLAAFTPGSFVNQLAAWPSAD